MPERIRKKIRGERQMVYTQLTNRKERPCLKCGVMVFGGPGDRFCRDCRDSVNVGRIEAKMVKVPRT